MFNTYLFRLVFRAGVFGYACYLFFSQPEKLSISEYFGIRHGFNAVDFFFCVLLVDVLSKFFPHAPIAMGSLKQFRTHHVPTRHTFEGGREALLAFVKTQWEEGKLAFDAVFTQAKAGVIEATKQLLHNIDFLKLLDYSENDLTADQKLRHDIRKRRTDEIIHVIAVWVILNSVVFWLLNATGWFSESAILLWTLFYFLADMICVIAWCPFQVLMMKNRCCTTCQIFNWDAIMTATPLIFLGGAFGWVLIGLSAIVLMRWEIAFARHPERFDERTNASLSCSHCKDRLCRLRPPLNRGDLSVPHEADQK